MPTYQITTPDKKVFEVDAPTAEAAQELIDKEVKAINRADSLEKTMGPAGAGELFQNAFSFGAYDKMAGLAGGLGGLLSGEGFSQGFETARRAQEIREERARQQSGNLGKAAEIGGAITSGVVAKAPQAASALGRIYQGGKEAGMLGLLQGAGDSEARTVQGYAGDVASTGAIGAGLGAGIGTALEIGRGIVKGTRGALGALESAAANPAKQGAKRVFNSLEADGLTPDAAAARVGRRETALVNVGEENTLGLARGISATPGPGRTVMNRTLDAQQKASQGKVTAAVDAALGGGDKPFNTRLRDMITDKANKANQMFPAAFRQGMKPETIPDLQALAQRIPSEALANAKKIAQADGVQFGRELVSEVGPDGSMRIVRMPSLQEWHFIQRGLRSAKNAAYKAGIGEVGSAYNSLWKQLRTTLDKSNPTYKAAMKAYSDESALTDALVMGRDLMKPNTLKNVDLLADELAGMSAAEKELFRVGAARSLKDELSRVPSEAGNVVKAIFGTPAKRDALKTAFGSDKAFRQFEVEMNRTAKELRAYGYVRQGSRTSFVDAEKQAAGALAEVADNIQNAATGGVTGAALTGLASILKSAGGMDEAVALEAAKILAMRDPASIMQALSAVQRGQATSQAVSALGQKAMAFLRAGNVGGSAGGAEMFTSDMRSR